MSPHCSHHTPNGDPADTAAADSATATSLTRPVNAWLEDHVDLDEQRRADVTLAVYEALANCVDHAYHGEQHPGVVAVHMRYATTARIAYVCVADRGRWLEPADRPVNRARGRGLQLMRALTDDLTVDGRPQGTTVCLHFHHCSPAALSA